MKGLLFSLDLGHTDKSEEIREKYNQILAEKGGEYLLEKLRQIDPISAEKLHEKDVNRIVRALEIFELTGKRKSDIKTELKSEYDYKLILLTDDRKVLYDRINLRVDKMLEMGLEDEVRGLIENNKLTRDNQSMSGIGYKEFFDYFDGKISREDLIYQIKQNSRHYAKRQLTWFKAMPNVEMYDCNKMQVIVENVKSFLEGTNN